MGNVVDHRGATSELELGSVSWSLVGQSNRRAFFVQGDTAKLRV